MTYYDPGDHSMINAPDIKMQHSLATSSFISSFQCRPSPSPGPGGLGDPGPPSLLLLDRIPLGAPMRERMAYVFVQAGRALRSSEVKDGVFFLNLDEYCRNPKMWEKTKATIRHHLTKYPEFKKIQNTSIKGVRGDLWKYIPEACTSTRGQQRKQNPRGPFDPEKGQGANQQPLVPPPRPPTPAGVTTSHSTLTHIPSPTPPLLNTLISCDPPVLSPVSTATPESVTSPPQQYFNSPLIPPDMFLDNIFLSLYPDLPKLLEDINFISQYSDDDPPPVFPIHL
ncbi:hypothetical protein FRC03_011931 [Tulasnella sp. 419]|nr:hypothetical protein FRC03_011931 [Tulasnella sp. 419]